MRHAELMHRLLQGLDDLPARHAVRGDHVVKGKAAHVVLERGDAARVDDLDPKRPRRLQRPGDMIADRARASRRAQEAEHEIVVAENRQDRLVDDGSVGEFQMRVQRVMRRDRRLDHGREAHLRIEAAGLEGGPAGIGERRRGGAARMGAMLFGQQQPSRVHVRARDMGMDVDAAGHHDQAALRRPSRRLGVASRPRHDLLVANPEVADFVAPVGRIDDAAAVDAGQHGQALASCRRGGDKFESLRDAQCGGGRRGGHSGQGSGIRRVQDGVVVDAGSPDRESSRSAPWRSRPVTRKAR